MTPEQAQAIYFAGQQAVVIQLCDLHAQVVALRQKVKEQEKIIAELSKDSSNSNKPPSSDDITKPKNQPKGRGKNKLSRLSLWDYLDKPGFEAGLTFQPFFDFAHRLRRH